jgi:periplasmic protein TonB
MKPFLKITLAAWLLIPLWAGADNLQLNGIAAQEQLRKEYYVGALYLDTPAHDAAAVASQPGAKKMVLRITADRWSPSQFAQQWNQMILINNGGAALNANVMDVLNFTGSPKGDLVAGDELAIELDRGATQVTLNGTPVVRSGGPNLFNMLLNTWIGARPPSSEFKRDILNLPHDKAGTDLLARFDTIKPSDARRKQVASWGTKEIEPAAAAVAAAAAAAPKPKAPETAPTPEPKKPAAGSTPDKAVATAAPPATAPAPSIPVATPTAASKPAPDTSGPSALEKRAVQQSLYVQYANQLRKLVSRNIVYPRRAISKDIEGLVVLKITLTRAGAVTAASVSQSADELIDNAAMEAVSKGAPYPAMTDEMEGASFDFMIPVVFKLKG